MRFCFPVLVQDEVIAVIVIDATARKQLLPGRDILLCGFEQFGRRNFRRDLIHKERGRRRL